MEIVNVDGDRLAYETTGHGRPVVLIGGSGMPSSIWDLSFRPALVAAGLRVLTVDCRGVGDSEAPSPPYSIPQIAHEVAGLIDHLALGSCVIVGLSAGGFVAEQLALQRPALVDALVLVASAGVTTAYMRAKVRAEEEMLATLGGVPPAYARIDALTVTLPSWVLQDDDETVTTWQELLSHGVQYADRHAEQGWGHATRTWLLDESRPGRWSQITAPCLVIAFEHDLQFPPSRGRAMADALPAGSFQEISGVAHGQGPFEAADALAQNILNFLPGSVTM